MWAFITCWQPAIRKWWRTHAGIEVRSPNYGSCNAGFPVEGSVAANRRKAVLALQRQHEYIANSRKDFLNKVAHSLITRYDCIVLEDLHINGMVRNHHLSKSILDAGWGYLKQRLADKAVEAGRQIVLVNPAYTSKTCSSCGELFPDLSLADRWIECVCGLSMDRDVNAAINVLRVGHTRWDESTDKGLRLSQEAPLLQ